MRMSEYDMIYSLYRVIKTLGIGVQGEGPDDLYREVEAYLRNNGLHRAIEAELKTNVEA